MDIDNMQAIWRKQQEILDQQKSIKERLLRESITKSSKWLAPNKIAIPILTFCCLFCIFAIIEGAYSLMDVFPILLMSLFGYLQMWWQTSLLRKIASMKGGLIGMESNLIKYRIYYMRSPKSSCKNPRARGVQARAVPRSTAHLRIARFPLRNGRQDACKHDRTRKRRNNFERVCA